MQKMIKRRGMWTEEELSMFKYFNPKEQYETFRQKYLPHRSKKSIIDKAQKLGIKSEFVSRKYFFNEDAWKYLTPESCYWAGFIAADGCVSKQTHSNGHVLSCCLKQTDSHHLLKLKEFCEYTGNLKNPMVDKRKNSIIQSLAISFGTIWLDDLKNNFNITPRKTLMLKPPNLENKYLIDCFIQGYWDGDGCIHFSKSKKILTFCSTCASQEFCQWTLNYLSKEFEKCSATNKTPAPKLFSKSKYNHQVRICGLRAAVIIDYYRQFPLPRLERKWENQIILEEIDRLKQKYPDKFLTLEIPPEFRS